jgi:hypothetical protein
MSNISSFGVAGLLGLASARIVACDRGGGEDPAGSTSTAVTAKATSAPAVTIRQGKDGRVSVEGAGPMQGDYGWCNHLYGARRDARLRSRRVAARER